MDLHAQLLIDFLLHCTGINESTAMKEAVHQYLRDRFAPKVLKVREGYMPFFEEGTIFYEFQNKYFFCLEINQPEVIEISGTDQPPMSEMELKSLEKAIVSFKEKYQKMNVLRSLTYIDDVTGLYNQRYLEAALDRELSLSKRNKNPFSVLFLDLDHFKEINDSHGHLVGSRALWEVGKEIKNTVRESDITFRFGGDEFVCILSNTDQTEAMVVAERVRICISNKKFLTTENLNVRLSVSIGVASYPDHALTREDILNAADKALYGVKESSRNKVILSRITKP